MFKQEPSPSAPPPAPRSKAPPVEPGRSIVRYRAGKDQKKRPVLQAVVVKVEGELCTLKVLGADGGTQLVERVQYSTDETSPDPRWF